MARLDDIKVIWNIIKGDIYEEIGHNLAEIWFDTLEVTDFDGECVTLFMGITESKSGEYGFMKLTDSSDTDLMKIDSSITDEECELTVKVNADGESVKLSFNGKKDVVDGKPALKFVTPEAEDGNPVA